MSEILLVTHPEASHVVDGLVGGWYDATLTPRGREQAHRIAEAIGTADAIFSSTLVRCSATAEVIAAHTGADTTLDPDLREQSYGVAGGHPPGTFPYTPITADVDALTHHDGVEGSETRLDVATRIYRATGRVLAAGHDRTVVVCHGGASSYVVTAWLGVPVEHVGSMRFAFSPGSITRLVRKESSGDRYVQTLADTSHLG